MKFSFVKDLYIPAASFSETFYGLKRITIVDSKIKSKLSNKQKHLSLILTVVFPYIKNKLSQLSQRYKLEELDGCAPKSVFINIFNFDLYLFFQIILKLTFHCRNGKNCIVIALSKETR